MLFPSTSDKVTAPQDEPMVEPNTEDKVAYMTHCAKKLNSHDDVAKLMGTDVIIWLVV